MDASFFSKPLSQLECRDSKKSCHLLEKKGTHPMRIHDNNTTCNRSNQNAGFLDTTNTTCNRSNQNLRLPDTHSHSTNQHPTAPDTTKTMCYRSAAQCWKAFLVMNNIVIHNSWKTAQNYVTNDIVNDINDKRPLPLHEQSWYRAALLKRTGKVADLYIQSRIAGLASWNQARFLRTIYRDWHIWIWNRFLHNYF